ncbi:amino acid ABC transporter ATP-binding/permease protein [Actinomadura madurae]|uniref:amino acid ABC transporter ATP-binding/permease protein n=1 Tax=Actinomadura madurae TaxID=1993 RepID=UPI0020D23A9A|nr:ABC transporter transmembrane domain-containing protein [Actinomadura madurae]MCQ0017586.1 ABC transporter transmembrane domain-containing protein [Actinomadura madurae]
MVVLRLIAFARPARARLGLAVLFGVLALGSGVGLMATSAWLISRAAQHPPVLMLMVAIVAVRAFGLGRGVFRYVERLVGHDATFRILADLRARVYERLERLAPGGLPAFRSGDLLNRLVADVDAVQDLFLRVLLPCTIAAVVGGASVGVAWALLPAAGIVLLLALVVAGVVAPWLSAVVSRRAERRTTDLRGELTSHVVDTLQGAPELIAYGAGPDQLAKAEQLDHDFTRATARSATTTGAGAAISALAGRSRRLGRPRRRRPGRSLGSLGRCPARGHRPAAAGRVRGRGRVAAGPRSTWSGSGVRRHASSPSWTARPRCRNRTTPHRCPRRPTPSRSRTSERGGRPTPRTPSTASPST